MNHTKGPTVHFSNPVHRAMADDVIFAKTDLSAYMRLPMPKQHNLPLYQNK